MTAPELVITRGIPASGKSTWAKAWVAEDPTKRARLNRDDYRAMMFGMAGVLPHELEVAIQDASKVAATKLLTSGWSVVADDMNLRPKYIREWEKLARSAGATLVIKEFPIELGEAIDRDYKRGRKLGATPMLEIWAKYLKGGEFHPFEPSPVTSGTEALYGPRPDLPSAVIVDIDGTVARNTGGRDFRDYTRVSEDTPNPRVIEAVQEAASAGHVLIFCSGRMNTCREDTITWLREHVFKGSVLDAFSERAQRRMYLLLMRAEGDLRKDAIVKRELFDAHIRDRYDVRRVYDDRDQVVDMWRTELGLTVMQVARGAF
jgi:predicted kinase